MSANVHQYSRSCGPGNGAEMAIKKIFNVLYR